MVGRYSRASAAALWRERLGDWATGRKTARRERLGRLGGIGLRKRLAGDWATRKI